MLCSCQHDDNLSNGNGSVIFSLSRPSHRNGRKAETATPAFVLLGIKDGQGRIHENIKLSLFPFGQSFMSESLQLPATNCQLIQYAILDSAQTVIYATPTEGSVFAKYVADPLPIAFNVSQNASIQLSPDVLQVSPTDDPGDFGYASFGFNVIDQASVVLIKASVVIEVGGVIYENLDAHIRVKGYDASDAMQWMKDYELTGPIDTLEVKDKFHHYSIELVDKWGVNDIQSDIPGSDIWNGRADGPLPVTYVLAGSAKAKKLSMLVRSTEVNTPGAGITYQPDTRVLYKYGGEGHLESIHYEAYNKQTSAFEEQMVEAFTFDGNSVSKITKNLSGKPYSEYHYEYGAKNIITETLYFDNSLVWTQTSAVDDDNSSVTVDYSLSNGNSFLYAFNFKYKNIVNDKTVQTGEVCNTGNYQYDKNINPLRHLGYLDFDLQNWSANNKLTEDVHYTACGFPVLIPVKHAYTYDADGYPIKKITTYRAGSFDDESNPDSSTPPRHSKVEFYYE
jgi:hypothetical protein